MEVARLNVANAPSSQLDVQRKNETNSHMLDCTDADTLSICIRHGRKAIPN